MARAPLAAALLAQCAGASWSPGCEGQPFPLCAAPWAHQPAPVLRWAAQADRCLEVPAGGEPLRLGGCAGRFRLEGAALQPEPPRCAVASRKGEGVLRAAPCGDGGDLLRLELPPRGLGVVRWAGRCLAARGGAVAVEPCDGDAEAQRWLAPTRIGFDAFVGANLGGWLVLEDWMWASELLNQGIRDEYSLIAKHGGPEDPRAQALMRKHWSSFLLPEHLDRLARFGVTHVRIPVGFWLFDAVYQASDGFVAGGEAYLRRALRWLQARGMRAVLDLHAMPGGQAVNSFTGRLRREAMFFRERKNFERGKAAVEAMADLVLAYERSADTSEVIVGIQLINEPDQEFWNAPLGIRAFYEDMVPRVRRKLSAGRYMLLLSFMDSPHVSSAEWMASARQRDPQSFGGVVYDAHVYHLWGDNQAPWSPDLDACKTCCRDRTLLEPMWSSRIPMIVGEYGVSTGFGGWDTGGFLRTHLENQLSLFSTTPYVVGSFIWNFRLLLAGQEPQMFKEWSLLDMVDAGQLPADGVHALDLSVLCPTLREKVPRECPSFDARTTLWTAPCHWELLVGAAPRRGAAAWVAALALAAAQC